MKKTKYKFNFKRFIINISILIIIVFIFFYSKTIFSNISQNRNNETLFVKSLKQALKSAGSQETYEIALKFRKKYSNSPHLGYAYFITGKYYYERGEYKKAIADFQLAKDYYLEEDIKIVLFLHLSYNYMCINDIVSSCEYAQKVYDLLEKGKLKALSSFQLALCFSAFKIYDKAIFFLEETDRLSDDLDIKKQAAVEKLKILRDIDKEKADRFELIVNKILEKDNNEKKASD